MWYCVGQSAAQPPMSENQSELCFNIQTAGSIMQQKWLTWAIKFHNMQNTILFLHCRWWRVSAWQSSCNWFHMCLYHIIKESTRRKTAVASDWDMKPSTGRKKKVREISVAYISPRLRVWISPWILFSRLCDCDPSYTSETLWKHQEFYLFLLTPLPNHLLPLLQMFFVLEKISLQCPCLTPEFHFS